MSTVHKTWWVALITLLFPLLASAATPEELVGPQPLTIDGATTHVYKTIGKDRRRLHVFSPDAPHVLARGAAIVVCFGGGWAQGSVTQFEPQGRHFAQRGRVASVADDRVFRRHRTSAFES